MPEAQLGKGTSHMLLPDWIMPLLTLNHDQKPSFLY